MRDYNPSNLFASARLVLTRHVTEYSPTRIGEYPRIFPNFQNYARCENDLKNNKHNSLHLGRKYARIFCPWMLSVPRSSQFTLSENCWFLGTDNVRRRTNALAYFLAKWSYVNNSELSSRKTVSFEEEQTMSKDKYPSTFSPQMEAIVFIILQIVFATRAVCKIGEYPVT